MTRSRSGPSGRRSAGPNAPRLNTPPPATVLVQRIGADGDGIASLPDGTAVYVPQTLPHETVVARSTDRHGDGWLASADAIEIPSPARVVPVCTHFGTCGGCVLQHWRDAEYLAWKTALLESALQRAGFESPEIAPVIPSGTGQRRRMDLAVRRLPAGLRLGLHRLRMAEIIDLTECHVLHPSLFALVAPLRTVLNRLQAIRREASVVANLTDSGADLLLRSDADLTLGDRNLLIAFARDHGVPRVSWARGADMPEPVCVLQQPEIALSGVVVVPPAGGFLQATRAAEGAIIQAVLAGLPEKLPPRARIADLYAGSGTLTFALADRARISAWEGDAASVAALRTAIGRAELSGRIEATQRDLVRQPLMAKELAGFSAVVLDPPHAGAAPQVALLAAARVPTVIYVSCNPAALGRDARLLREAGYRLELATPIDQFLWSTRLESVCVFRI